MVDLFILKTITSFEMQHKFVLLGGKIAKRKYDPRGI